MLSFEQSGAGTGDGVSTAAEAVDSTGVQPLWFAQIDGPEFTCEGVDTRFGGVFVAPRETVLGIRLWRDVYEGVEAVGDAQVHWSIYEIEKIVRMMLHQSPLALEILSSGAAVERFASSRFQPRRVVEAAVTSDILTALVDDADGFLTSPEASSSRRVAIRGLRRVLMGLALAEGVVATRLDDLLEWRGSEELADAAATGEADAISTCGRELLEDLRAVDAPALPESPADYDGLDDLVVDMRMATSRRPDDPSKGGDR